MGIEGAIEICPITDYIFYSEINIGVVDRQRESCLLLHVVGSVCVCHCELSIIALSLINPNLSGLDDQSQSIRTSLAKFPNGIDPGSIQHSNYFKRGTFHFSQDRNKKKQTQHRESSLVLRAIKSEIMEIIILRNEMIIILKHFISVVILHRAE